MYIQNLCECFVNMKQAIAWAGRCQQHTHEISRFTATITNLIIKYAISVRLFFNFTATRKSESTPTAGLGRSVQRRLQHISTIEQQ